MNGFANRILWVVVRRSKLLPSGGDLQRLDLSAVIRRLQEALAFARTAGEMQRDDAAQELWNGVYEPLVGDHRTGLFGAATARAAPLTMRIAMIYAILDCSPVIKEVHLAAALEVWRYCEDSARFIFGDRIGDRIADEVLAALRQAGPGGITRTDLHRHFGRNTPAEKIAFGLNLLAGCNLARSETDVATGGRPAERWFAVK
jgi:hypothetical protein